MDPIQHELDRLKASPTGAWLKGPKITAADLRRGSGNIEHIPAAEFFGRAGTAAGGVGAAGSKAAPQAAQINLKNDKTRSKTGVTVMWFGKHKGQEVHWVRQHDPGYYRWACENVQGFRAIIENGQDKKRDERN